MSDEHVPLDRTFHALSIEGGDTDESEYRTRRVGSQLSWAELRAGYRTVILSAAGSGKTEEIRCAARDLRQAGEAAFFLRLEHVYRDFDIAFEEGSLADFEQWLESDAEGWIFLDSVDEARLGEPLDFERAIKRMGARLANAQQRVHIILSGRETAWRPVTDLALCRQHFPYDPPAQDTTEKAQKAAERAGAHRPFWIVALDDLDAEQVGKFAAARGVKPAQPFLRAIERADAWPMAARPDDLNELIDFWIKNGRIGDRLELMRASIRRRLAERDQNRAEAMPLSEDEAIAGAHQIAAATTMAQHSLIRIPDGAQNAKGLPATEMLPDWDQSKLAPLLTRPIFDAAIYGAVRFHHREVREFLTAEWLKRLLDQQTSRRKVEAILFRSQYGAEVVVPAMRPVLVWLILLDEKIRARALAISPELIFEGGEPKALPPAVRRAILSDICEAIKNGDSPRSSVDYRAVQRFAHHDIGDHVRTLLKKYAGNSDLQNFLVRMVWQGEIAVCLPEVVAIAADRQVSVYTRVAAFRAVQAIGNANDIASVRKRFLSEAAALNRELAAEFITDLPPNSTNLDWLIECLGKLKPKSRHSHDGLTQALDSFVRSLDLSLMPRLIDALQILLIKRPHVEVRHCEISQRHGWLIKGAAVAVERLVAARDGAALKKSALSILKMVPSAQHYRDWALKDISSALPTLIAAWHELNDALFWRNIEDARRKEKKERVVAWWQAGPFRSYWQFGPTDFARVLGYVSTRPLSDDRRVALSLAFRLYVDAKRPAALRTMMKRATADSHELQAALHEHLNPAPDEQAKKWRRQEASYKRRNRLREAADAKREAHSKDYLTKNFELLRDPKLPEPHQLTSAQHYLHEKMRTALSHSGPHWSAGNWRSLEEPYGPDVAKAFRDGAVAYWRRNNPKLLSEGKSTNGTPFSSIFGLTGLCIEARETDDWAATLTRDDARLASRYAMEELNGFPDWLPTVHHTFPDETLRVLLKELDYNLKVETTKVEHHYVLSDLSSSGAWAWTALGPEILKRLQQRSPKHIRNLEQMLDLLLGSGLDDEVVARLAERKSSDRRLPHAARWYATWTGVEPEKAIPAFTARLANTHKGKTTLAMMFITCLLGGRRSGRTRMRDAFRTAPHLKELYLLIQHHVRESEDIERAGKGVYSPGLRDDAQDARHHLFSLLKEIPGKEAYLALVALGELHPVQSSRPWMLHHAKTKAAADADLSAWSIVQTLEFQDTIERTPATHRELFELAELRFHDLKDELEGGDSSIADILLRGATQEPQMRKFIGGWCRDRALGRYSIVQEEELADAKRPDLRMHGASFDAPVPIELKLADKWSGNALFERLETQLSTDYMRDNRSSRGLFVLVYRGEQQTWRTPNASTPVTFDGLVAALQTHWTALAPANPSVDDIIIVGIDLTRRVPRKAKGAKKRAGSA